MTHSVPCTPFCYRTTFSLRLNTIHPVYHCLETSHLQKVRISAMVFNSLDYIWCMLSMFLLMDYLHRGSSSVAFLLVICQIDHSFEKRNHHNFHVLGFTQLYCLTICGQIKSLSPCSHEVTSSSNIIIFIYIKNSREVVRRTARGTTF